MLFADPRSFLCRIWSQRMVDLGGMGFIWSWLTIMRLAFLAGVPSGAVGLTRAHHAVVLRLFCFVRFDIASQSFDPL